MVRDNEYIGKIGKRCIVGDDTPEPNLIAGTVNSKAERVLDGLFHHPDWNILGPVGRAEKLMNEVDVQTVSFSRNLVEFSHDVSLGL